MYTYERIFSGKQRILFFPAHPDDIMVYFGGLVNRLVADGKEIFVVTVSDGSRGSKGAGIPEGDLAKIRRAEEYAALDFMGIPSANRACLGYPDGEVEANMELIGKIAYWIRKFKPDLVATHEPKGIYLTAEGMDGYWVQHRDHRKTAEAVIDATYPFSRDRSFFPEHAKDGLQPFSVFDLLLTEEGGVNFKFDYTEAVDRKKSAMRCYKSQMDDAFIDSVVEGIRENGRYLEYFQYVHLLW